MVPQGYDQFNYGKRIEELEAGIFLDKRKIKITPDVLKNAVNDIITKREKYKKGIDKLVESFNEDRNNRKKYYEQIFI